MVVVLVLQMVLVGAVVVSCDVIAVLIADVDLIIVLVVGGFAIV